MKKINIIPSSLTLGNAVCGFAAIVKVGNFAMNPDKPEYLVIAAWLILIAMLLDSLDGKVARITKTTSDIGCQLDSLSDAISFGVAPAFLATIWNSKFLVQPPTETFWANVTWFFCLSYALAAVLRLARFNVENKHDKEHHQNFVGLPTPGAAGLVASLVILHKYLLNLSLNQDIIGAGIIGSDTAGWLAKCIPALLPLVMIILAFLMVSSRIKYVHVLNKLFSGKKTFDYFTYLLFASILLVLIMEIALVGAFLVYALSGPVYFFVSYIRAVQRERRSAFSSENNKGVESGKGKTD
ncbi:MAG: CDP-diacylglycerol--serine O-phosphatidyltransferase [Planctomycetota bacterium]